MSVEPARPEAQAHSLIDENGNPALMFSRTPAGEPAATGFVDNRAGPAGKATRRVAAFYTSAGFIAMGRSTRSCAPAR